jgi:FMN phosphatase YigB (HAD superfamily)
LKNINTILFDLDGTLLSINMKDFEDIYYKSLSEYFKNIIPPENFMKILYSSVMTMIKNTEYRTNEEVFMDSMKSYVKDDFELYAEMFSKYYEDDFHILKKAVLDTTEMQEATKIFKNKGYNLVIATNPLFPKEAIEQRIEWSGIVRKDFSYVSYFEKNHFCKPNIEYYEEILEIIQKSPEECMMVGNDALEDLVAGKLGITTYLITDHLLNRKNIEIVADHVGDYKDFLAFAEIMPSINNMNY